MGLESITIPPCQGRGKITIETDPKLYKVTNGFWGKRPAVLVHDNEGRQVVAVESHSGDCLLAFEEEIVDLKVAYRPTRMVHYVRGLIGTIGSPLKVNFHHPLPSI